MTEHKMDYIRFFETLRNQDIPSVGGKNASLGEMYSQLKQQQIQVPNGFATTAEAFWLYLEHNQLREKIQRELDELSPGNIPQLQQSGRKIRQWVIDGEFPKELEQAISQAYTQLCQKSASKTVALRSSATAEDLPSASFAGQQETYLNISGIDRLLSTCKKVYASLYTDRAISYRVDQGFAHANVALSIGVQTMVRADKGCSGVIFTLDTETGFRDVVVINAAYGLGENVVQGKVTPDEYQVFKTTLKNGHRPIIKKQLGEKAIKMVYNRQKDGETTTRDISVPNKDRQHFALNDDEILQLARYATAIEDHYSKLRGTPTPMDIEWGKDGISGELYILQARPETVQSNTDTLTVKRYHLTQRGELLIEGTSIGEKISSGTVRLIHNPKEMNKVRPGDILVTDITDPDWEPIMKIAGGIITNRGGRTCHAAIIARELGIPTVVGCGNATEKLTDGSTVTLSCAEGSRGYIYQGQLPFTIEQQTVAPQQTTAIKTMVNIGNPDLAFSTSLVPNDGVGLARMEFIINHTIGIHPKALLEYSHLPKKMQSLIKHKSHGYESPKAFYIQKLAEGIGTIAAAFYPKPVIVRFSDFKSNEYATLIGGEQFEPKEENPMIGFRGAVRYPSEQFRDCFAMECAAIRQVREVMGLDNVILLIPFARTVAECRLVIELLNQEGLRRGEHGLKIYLMCEVPSNALLADQYLDLVDGFSIGSNDLTQLTLGIDRDSPLAGNYDARDDAVKTLIKMAIEACNRQGKYIGICGQAPSDFPEFAQWLIDEGINSISLNPDSIFQFLSR